MNRPLSPCSPIGLDLGTRAIKAAQVTGRGRRLRLRAAAVLPRLETGGVPGEEELARLIRVLDRRGFVGRRVVAAVPGERLFTTVLELPPAGSGAPRMQIVRGEMARAHRQSEDALEVAAWDLPQGGGQSGQAAKTLAVACSHDDARPLLTALESAGLSVCALDIPPWAVLRACRRFADRPGQLYAAVDLGWRAATLVLMIDHVVLYHRTLGGFGGEGLVSAIRREGDLPPELIPALLRRIGLCGEEKLDPRDRPLAMRLRGPLQDYTEALAQELALSLDYALQQYPRSDVQMLMLLGGGAGVPGLAEGLYELLDLEVEPLAAADVLSCPASLNCERLGGELTQAIGLALCPPGLGRRCAA
ncbi:MAG: pilus assembly protein PilM [Phycisphaeraceae bacterium]